MNKVLIISRNFRAAHVSHLMASYNLFLEMGYLPILFVHPDCIPFLPVLKGGGGFITSFDELQGKGKVEYSMIWFPSLKNLITILKLRLRYKSKVMYVLHEPLEPLKNYLTSGNSLMWTLKFALKYYINATSLLISNRVVLCSDKAKNLYKKSLLGKIKRKTGYLPILFDDERNKEEKERKYFSYIGTICKDHSYDQFIDFIYNLSKESNVDIKNIQFLIATRFNVERTAKVNRLLQEGRLVIIEGKPMTNEEINSCYAQSYAVWNAYNRTTQSGVLAKSFMFGTPVVLLKKNLSEFVKDNVNVVAVSSNENYTEIRDAIKKIVLNFPFFSLNARKSFEENYYYRNFIKNQKDIIDSLG